MIQEDKTESISYRIVRWAKRRNLTEFSPRDIVSARIAENVQEAQAGLDEIQNQRLGEWQGGRGKRFLIYTNAAGQQTQQLSKSA